MARQGQDGQTGMAKTSGNRGFAAMDAERQRAIASRGGRAAHEQGTAHQFTSEEARAAGRKGGQAAHQSGKAHEFTSEEARAAGRKGGQASHGNGRRRRVQQNEVNGSNDNLQRNAANSDKGVERDAESSPTRMQRADDGGGRADEEE